MGIKILLKYQRRCFAIHAFAARCRQHGRGVALVHQCGGQAETTMYLVGETSTARSHVMLCTVGMQWQADDDCLRLPLADQRSDGGKLRIVGGSINHCQWPRLLEQTITHCNADPAQTEIEGHHRAHTRYMLPTASGMVRSRVPGYSAATGPETQESRMPGIAREHGRIDAEQVHRCRQSFFYRRLEQDDGIGADREPAIAEYFIFQLAGTPASTSERDE